MERSKKFKVEEVPNQRGIEIEEESGEKGEGRRGYCFFYIVASTAFLLPSCKKTSYARHKGSDLRARHERNVTLQLP